MNKIIVTTTINTPTEAMLKFAKMTDWHVVVAGDTKTPHDEYQKMNNVTYLHPEDQESMSKELSDSIGWKSIQRRNFALLKAYQMGADVVATVDDDNIPYENWGKEIFVGKNIDVDLYTSKNDVFDPIFATEHKNLWHRGFPLQLVSKRDAIFLGKTKVECLVQADFWDGDPDIDAFCRITQNPIVKFKKFGPFTSNVIAPFNSQNTFLHRDVIPYYMVIPHIGRMDDIWGAYLLQKDFESKKPFVVYNQATVYQERNPHDLTKDLEGEMIGYRQSLDFVLNDHNKILPSESKKCYELYKSLFKS